MICTIEGCCTPVPNPTPTSKYCEEHRHKARLDRAAEYRRTHPVPPREKKPCAFEGCVSLRVGNSICCLEHKPQARRLSDQIRRFNKSVAVIASIVCAPAEPEDYLFGNRPPTSMAWLAGFNEVLKERGGVYNPKPI